MKEANIFDVVLVGRERLIGEIIEMRGDRASIQVYEETSGIGRADEVISTGEPLSVELGPGLISNIYDGIQRPLEKLCLTYGALLSKGAREPALDREKRWHFEATASVGDELIGGSVIGAVKETDIVTHKIMLPPTLSGKITEIASGEYTVNECVSKILTDAG